jgi:hypothetical protein
LKILCPVCGVQGILEQRGNSSRVLHYKGFVDGKRIHEKHRLGITDGNNGNKSVGTDKAGNSIFTENKVDMVDRWGFEPQTSALRMRRSYQTELPAPGSFL